MNKYLLLGGEVPAMLYHGTCKAFILYSLQNQRRFEPEFGSISFTPSLDYAKVFAESWETQRGYDRLRDFFRNSINGQLLYVEKGPINLHLLRIASK